MQYYYLSIMYLDCWTKSFIQTLSKNDKQSSLQTEEILVAARISMFQGHSDAVLVHFVYIDHQTQTAQVCWPSLFL